MVPPDSPDALASVSHIWTRLISPDDEELWETRLWEEMEEGRGVILSRPDRKRVTLQIFLRDEEEGQALLGRHGGRVTRLEREDWLGSEQTRPVMVKVRDRLVVTSETGPEALDALSKAHPGRTILSIPAELAFGTGDHATTATCLRLLVDGIAERGLGGTDHGPAGAGWSLLDLGTGSGILALAAAALGAERVVGWENDPLALAVAEKNVKRHAFAGDRVALGGQDVLSWEPEPAEWEVVTANLFADILRAIFPQIRRALKPGGMLIISGILREQADETLAAAEAAGFRIQIVKRVGKWVSARLTPEVA